MKLSLLLFFIIFSTNSFCQTDSTNKVDTPFTVIEEMPYFVNGGEEGLMKIISDSVRYPAKALKDKIGGKVKVQFTIDTTGNIGNIRILKGIREDIDQEALRVVSLLNNWHPGRQNGRKVQVVYTIQIGFWPTPKFKRKYLKNELKEKKIASSTKNK